MKKLILGIVSWKDLAEWFNQARIYTTQKENKLKELEYFCKYSITSAGKVKIEEIYEDTYVSQKLRIIEAAEDYLKYFTTIHPGEHIGTSMQVARDLITKYNFSVSPEYVARYVSESIKRDYGKNSTNPGVLGSRKYAWIKCSTNIKNPYCEPLSEQELKDMKKIVAEIFTSREFAEMLGKVKDNELSEEELKKIAEAKYINLYDRTIKYFHNKYYLVIRGTHLFDAETVG